MVLKNKPKIMKCSFHRDRLPWVCFADNCVGYGNTPKEAYRNMVFDLAQKNIRGRWIEVPPGYRW